MSDRNERFTTAATLAQVARVLGLAAPTLTARRIFDLDVCADAESSCGVSWYTRNIDGLSQSWVAPTVWCNPPFNELDRWVRKAWAEHTARSFGLLAMLMPARRTEQPFWQEFIEPHRDRSPEFRSYFLAGRPRFGSPGNLEAEGVGSPTFGCVLLVWRDVR